MRGMDLYFSTNGYPFERLDMNLSRQTLANWMISMSDRYLELMYRRMHQEILKSKMAEVRICLGIS